jgi:hypothetical protein
MFVRDVIKSFIYMIFKVGFLVFSPLFAPFAEFKKVIDNIIIVKLVLNISARIAMREN